MEGEQSEAVRDPLWRGSSLKLYGTPYGGGGSDPHRCEALIDGRPLCAGASLRSPYKLIHHGCENRYVFGNPGNPFKFQAHAIPVVSA
ncbi:hypothetical protein EYF80_043218 [Liparis tanakae]|uniref:Uncharacterized protein n=1 Tax=Liparis tanakae TaxID=230148 RepID=A0A4Z2FZA7_9TELE|nr:hypothetical protein EYF80_043218 [Liparis tanakae]